MPVDRRELFTILGAGLVAQSASAQHEHKTPVTPQGAYKPRVLSAAQYATLQRLLELLLPADETSASARDAGVGMYIDTTLQHGDAQLRGSWTTGLDAVNRLAHQTHGIEFANLPFTQATALLVSIAEAEGKPNHEAEHFFVLFKQSAISAYYLSDAGRRSLAYRGDTAIRDFAGCTHPEHRA
jgi:hypothetical protein